MVDPTASKANLSPRELAEKLALEAIALKAENVTALEVTELLYVTDFFVIATTRSSRQTRGLAEALNDLAKKATGHKGRIEGTQHSSWLLMDLGSVVVHILTEEAREFYNLDGLWSDAPQLDLPDSSPANLATQSATDDLRSAYVSPNAVDDDLDLAEGDHNAA
jgi:ribosome-associated protein